MSTTYPGPATYPGTSTWPGTGPGPASLGGGGWPFDAVTCFVIWWPR